MTTFAEPTTENDTAALTAELVRETYRLAREGTEAIAKAAAFYAEYAVGAGARVLLDRQVALALRIATSPVQGPQGGVECHECEEVGAWATVRVWTEGGDFPFDDEVCSTCASRLLDGEDSAQAEPMSRDHYRWHGIEVADPEPSEWDTVTAGTYPVVVDDGFRVEVLGGAA